MYEISTSQTLLGERKNGKWGWVDSNNVFVIQPIYDSGFVTCFNGIIIMQKHGEWGGIYRKNELIVFSFKYAHLSHAYGKTYVARNSFNKCALVKSGDNMLTGFNYKGFSVYNNGNVTKYVKSRFLGESKGFIDFRNRNRTITKNMPLNEEFAYIEPPRKGCLPFFALLIVPIVLSIF